MLLRFAGTRLAASSDDLTPVRLRRGGRVLGGSLSWDTPKRLAPFERESPFHGLNISDEISVTRQVLAEPEAGLPGCEPLLCRLLAILESTFQVLRDALAATDIYAAQVPLRLRMACHCRLFKP